MAWQQPLTIEERFKTALVPPRLYIRWRADKELRKGEKELHLLPFLVDRNRVAVDIGANKGVWTQILSGLCARVESFEPNPKLFSILSRGLPRGATAHQIALSNTPGSAELRIPKSAKGYSNQGASLSTVKVPDNYASIEVRSDRLDALSIPNVGFMKIDVEGHEMAVLEGARETILRDRPSMIIEMEERHTKQPIETMIATTEAYGYRCLALRHGVLTDARLIDMDKHHRAPQRRADYIFNFIFLPNG